jgi:hypothetical protein
MELKKLIAPAKSAFGLSCHNCANLAWEYDLDRGGSGEWICGKYPGRVNSGCFPFQHDMPCFELSFWFSVFAQNLSENDDAGCEAALDSFNRSLAKLNRQENIESENRLPMLQP